MLTTHRKVPKLFSVEDRVLFIQILTVWILETPECGDLKVLRYRRVSIMLIFRLRQFSLYISRLNTCAYRRYIRYVRQVFHMVEFDAKKPHMECLLPLRIEI